MLWWIISSERKYGGNQDYAVVLLGIKAGGKVFQTRITITDFMKLMDFMDFRLAVTMYKFSRGDYIYIIGGMSGLAMATVCTIVSETCTVIINTLWDDTVKRHFPTLEDDIRQFMRRFGEEWQFPYAFTAVGGSYLPIKCPNGGAQAMKQCFNCKGFYSIVLMALVDAKYRFNWASVGAPGNTHDSTLLQ